MRRVPRAGSRFAGLGHPGLAAAALAGLSMLVSGQAVASTDESWEELFTEARAACLETVELSAPQVLGEPLVFDNVLVIFVKGLWPQEHMKNEPPASFVCVYDRAGKTATAQEAGIEFPSEQ